MASRISFADVWARVRSLEGKDVALARRGTIRILKVDSGGVSRRTSTGHNSRMAIRSFQWVVRELENRDQLDRLTILEGIGRWESSGVLAVLAATGLYEITIGQRVGLRRRRP
jgi:hypothetical protein